jgi:hypothetical protein
VQLVENGPSSRCRKRLVDVAHPPSSASLALPVKIPGSATVRTKW